MMVHVSRFQRLRRKRAGIPPGPLPVLGKILVCLDWVLPRQEGAFADCRTEELALDYDSTPVCVYRLRRQVTKGTINDSPLPRMDEYRKLPNPTRPSHFRNTLMQS